MSPASAWNDGGVDLDADLVMLPLGDDYDGGLDELGCLDDLTLDEALTAGVGAAAEPWFRVAAVTPPPPDLHQHAPFASAAASAVPPGPLAVAAPFPDIHGGDAVPRSVYYRAASDRVTGSASGRSRAAGARQRGQGLVAALHRATLALSAPTQQRYSSSFAVHDDTGDFGGVGVGGGGAAARLVAHDDDDDDTYGIAVISDANGSDSDLDADAQAVAAALADVGAEVAPLAFGKGFSLP